MPESILSAPNGAASIARTDTMTVADTALSGKRAVITQSEPGGHLISALPPNGAETGQDARLTEASPTRMLRPSACERKRQHNGEQVEWGPVTNMITIVAWETHREEAA